MGIIALFLLLSSKVIVIDSDTLRFVARGGTHDVFAPGRYYFQCDPHVSRGMIGHLRVQPASQAIVLLVRHADKAPAATLDPPLSDAGRARAAALANALRDAGVTRILVDQSQRTQETAGPLSQRRGLRPEVIPIDWNDPTSQVRGIADSVRRAGAVALVIGHRNTVPAIIRALGGPVVPEIRDTDYDDLYILVLGAGAAPPVFIHSSYGGTR
jgi:phosphohistidine phosphatase SixA